MTDAPTPLLPTVWTMHTADGVYPILPSFLCKPEDQGLLNPHVLEIRDIDGKLLWKRTQK